MRETAEGFVDVGDGVRLHYTRRGSGPAVIVPAQGWLAGDMEALAPEHTVVFYDLRARGRSTCVLEDERIGFEFDLADLEKLRTALELERASFVGWSYHGALTARYALRHPERVERLVLIAPSGPAGQPFFPAFLENFARRIDGQRLGELEAARRAGLKERDPVAWCRRVHALFFRAYAADGAAIEQMKSSPCQEPNLDAERVNNQGRKIHEWLADYDWREDFHALDVPTLLLHGVEDPVLLAGSEAWLAALPNARLLTFEGVGHLPWVECPEAFFAAVNPFLAGRWPEGARSDSG